MHTGNAERRCRGESSPLGCHRPSRRHRRCAPESGSVQSCLHQGGTWRHAGRCCLQLPPQECHSGHDSAGTPSFPAAAAQETSVAHETYDHVCMLSTDHTGQRVHPPAEHAVSSAMQRSGADHHGTHLHAGFLDVSYLALELHPAAASGAVQRF